MMNEDERTVGVKENDFLVQTQCVHFCEREKRMSSRNAGEKESEDHEFKNHMEKTSRAKKRSTQISIA